MTTCIWVDIHMVLLNASLYSVSVCFSYLWTNHHNFLNRKSPDNRFMLTITLKIQITFSCVTSSFFKKHKNNLRRNTKSNYKFCIRQYGSMASGMHRDPMCLQLKDYTEKTH